MQALKRNDLPRAHEIHAYLIDGAPSVETHKQCGGNVVEFKSDDADTGCWESVLMPKDCLGPSHVIYFADRVEVWRYWTAGGCVELAATFGWDDPQLLAKVLVAATEDISADWYSMI